jgi:DnaJ-class molecular chaperone
MAKDYYQILNVGKTASSLDIAASFRILALQTHPDKNKVADRLALATFAFSEICEAYEILSTPELKEIYDKYGEELMKTGVPDKKFGFKAGYKFQGNSFEIFEKFFGTLNPYTVALDEHAMQIGSLQAKSSHMEMLNNKF